MDIRFWHKADVQTALMNVRFEENNGHDVDMMGMSAHDPKPTFNDHTATVIADQRARGHPPFR